MSDGSNFWELAYASLAKQYNKLVRAANRLHLVEYEINRRLHNEIAVNRINAIGVSMPEPTPLVELVEINREPAGVEMVRTPEELEAVYEQTPDGGLIYVTKEEMAILVDHLMNSPEVSMCSLAADAIADVLAEKVRLPDVDQPD